MSSSSSGIPEIPSLFEESELPRMLKVSFRNPKERESGVQVFHSSLVQIHENPDLYLAASLGADRHLSFLLGTPTSANPVFRTAKLEDWLSYKTEIVQNARYAINLPEPYVVSIRDCHRILLSKIQEARNTLRRQRYAIRMATKKRGTDHDSAQRYANKPRPLAKR